MEDCFLASAALSMRVAIFSLREYIPIDHLTIIERGIAAKEGRLKIKGTAIGFDMIIEKEHLRDMAPVIALTVVVQAMYLPRKDLLAVLGEAPKAMNALRHAAFRIAMQRMVMKVANEIRYHQKRTGGARLSVQAALDKADLRALAERHIRQGLPIDPSSLAVEGLDELTAGVMQAQRGSELARVARAVAGGGGAEAADGGGGGRRGGFGASSSSSSSSFVQTETRCLPPCLQLTMADPLQSAPSAELRVSCSKWS